MMGFGFGGMGFVYMLIFWVVIIALAIWLLSRLFPRVNHNSSSGPVSQPDELSESPLEILQQRYARGEISKTEYDEMRHDLEG